MRSFRFWILAIAVSAAASVAAEEPPANPYAQLAEATRGGALDLGLSTGWNNPGGAIGVEGEFRLGDHFGAGAGIGIGGWGFRATPQARVYPFGAHARGTPIFLEVGLALNTGGSATLKENGTSYVVQQGFTPTANVSLGMRKGIWESAFAAVRVGYAATLVAAGSNYTVENGATLPGALQSVLNLSQPGGLIVGASLGWSFL